MKYLRLIPILLSLAVMVMPLNACSSKKTTTTTTTEYQDHNPQVYDAQGESRTETKTVEVEKEHERHGIFGILIDIIVLPFRAVGALFGAIL